MGPKSLAGKTARPSAGRVAPTAGNDPALTPGRGCKPVRRRSRGARLRRRAAIFAVATTVATAIAVGPNVAAGLAATGSVHYDSNDNVGAGHDSFNGTFTGFGNVGIG